MIDLEGARGLGERTAQCDITAHPNITEEEPGKSPIALGDQTIAAREVDCPYAGPRNAVRDSVDTVGAESVRCHFSAQTLAHHSLPTATQCLAEYSKTANTVLALHPCAGGSIGVPEDAGTLGG